MKHTREEFNTFMSQLAHTNATLSYFSDFHKCSENLQKIAVRLNQLNYLVGKENFERAVNDLWEENPKVFSVMDILIAVRKKDKKLAFDRDGEVCRVDSFFETKEKVLEFLEDTGLKEVFRNKHVTNLVDYVFGIEVGFDTNARKNRSGDAMRNVVFNKFAAAGIPFATEVSNRKFPECKGLGVDNKVFDFVIKTTRKIYLIEVNFYNKGGGSKPNEIARSYTDIAPKINNNDGFEFVWITDGLGWQSAKNKLEEAFYNIPKVYNLSSLEDFISIIQTENACSLL